jgi:hypothetical protein
VLGATSPVGEVIRVTGVCADGNAPPAVGDPPVSGRHWLLQAEGVAVFVTGAAPTRCGGGHSGRAADVDSITILARVAEDTLPRLAGSMPAAPRRYLVRLDR